MEPTRSTKQAQCQAKGSQLQRLTMREGTNGAHCSRWSTMLCQPENTCVERYSGQGTMPSSSTAKSPRKQHVIALATGTHCLSTKNHTFSPRASSKQHHYSPADLTMKIKASTKPKRTTQSSNGYLFKPFQASWPESAEKIKVKLGTDGTSFSDYFHQLEGTESPELFLLWLQ